MFISREIITREHNKRFIARTACLLLRKPADKISNVKGTTVWFRWWRLYIVSICIKKATFGFYFITKKKTQVFVCELSRYVKFCQRYVIFVFLSPNERTHVYDVDFLRKKAHENITRLTSY